MTDTEPHIRDSLGNAAPCPARNLSKAEGALQSATARKADELPKLPKLGSPAHSHRRTDENWRESRNFRLFEGLGHGSRRRDKRASNATGEEGSARGQVEKTEEFGQSQSEDEIRRQRGREPRRLEGCHHNLDEPRRKHQRLQAHGAGDGEGQRSHPVQIRHTRVPRRGAGKGVFISPDHWQLELHSQQALLGRPHGRGRGRRRRREQERQKELEFRRKVTGIGREYPAQTRSVVSVSSGAA